MPIGPSGFMQAPGAEVFAVNREAVSKLRRWCPDCEVHMDADDRVCGMSHCDRRPRKRRMLVCSVCQQGYFNRTDFGAHECYSAY